MDINSHTAHEKGGEQIFAAPFVVADACSLNALWEGSRQLRTNANKAPGGHVPNARQILDYLTREGERTLVIPQAVLEEVLTQKERDAQGRPIQQGLIKHTYINEQGSEVTRFTVNTNSKGLINKSAEDFALFLRKSEHLKLRDGRPMLRAYISLEKMLKRERTAEPGGIIIVNTEGKLYRMNGTGVYERAARKSTFANQRGDREIVRLVHDMSELIGGQCSFPILSEDAAFIRYSSNGARQTAPFNINLPALISYLFHKGELTFDEGRMFFEQINWNSSRGFFDPSFKREDRVTTMDHWERHKGQSYEVRQKVEGVASQAPGTKTENPVHRGGVRPVEHNLYVAPPPEKDLIRKKPRTVIDEDRRQQLLELLRRANANGRGNSRAD